MFAAIRRASSRAAPCSASDLRPKLARGVQRHTIHPPRSNPARAMVRRYLSCGCRDEGEGRIRITQRCRIDGARPDKRLAEKAALYAKIKIKLTLMFLRRTKAAGSGVPSKYPQKIFRPTRETSVWFHNWQCGGVLRKGYPRCKSVEKKKTDSIGGSPWNTLGGNSENFIRPQTRRRDCTLYSQRSVGGRERCAEKISMARMAE